MEREMYFVTCLKVPAKVFLMKFVGGTLVNNIMCVSSVPFYDTFFVCRTVYSPPKV